MQVPQLQKDVPIDPRLKRYSEETKERAKAEYESGISAREVARRHGMNKGNVAYWLKKNRRGRTQFPVTESGQKESMKTAKQIPGKICPFCGNAENQIRHGKTASGTQRCMCLGCKKTYTIDPKRIRYSEETKAEAVAEYESGLSAREVARKHNMCKGNVANWLKKSGGETS